jgi:hypothetical protein
MAAAGRRGVVSDILFVLGFLAAWIFLQAYLLPELGVGT